MNRMKKIEQERYTEKTKNLNEDEKKIFDTVLELQEQYESLVHKLHTLIFPEEYDFMYDSIEEAEDRKKGNNPMRETYIKRINEKRKRLGVLSLNNDGMPSAGVQESSMEYCKKLLSKEVEIF